MEYMIDDFLTESEEVAINLLLKGLSGDTTGQIMKSCLCQALLARVHCG
jgi:hypothetical protein